MEGIVGEKEGPEDFNSFVGVDRWHDSSPDLFNETLWPVKIKCKNQKIGKLQENLKKMVEEFTSCENNPIILQKLTF